MKTFKFTLSFFSATAALFLCGCVYIGSDLHSDAAWPRPIAAADVRQFDGIYWNDSLLAMCGKGQPPAKLFDFLIGENHSHGEIGESVEIHSAAGGSILRIRLLDRQNREIDSAILAQGKTFAPSHGALSLYGPFSGRHSETSNFGPSTQYQRDKMRLAATNGLLGYESDHQAGLIVYIIPEAMMTQSSMYWPKLAQ